MTDSTEITEVQGEIIPMPNVQLGSIATRNTKELIQQASDIATQLSAIVEEQHLYTQIGKARHINVTGWSTMGAMIGVLPRELDDKTRRLEDGSYVATVELIRASDGAVIGRASSICGMDEVDRYGKPTWAARPEYARRSMAVTRATGKAFRLGFAWIVKLAGYSATPAEEMTGVQPFQQQAQQQQKAKPKSQPPAGKRPYTPETVKKAIASRVSGKSTAPASEKQQNLLAGKLNECFADQAQPDLLRHSVTGWLVGKTSTKDMTKAEASALLDWLLEGEGSYDLHPAAAQEAANIMAEALKDSGQQELPVVERQATGKLSTEEAARLLYPDDEVEL